MTTGRCDLSNPNVISLDDSHGFLPSWQLNSPLILQMPLHLRRACSCKYPYAFVSCRIWKPQKMKVQTQEQTTK